LPKLFVSGTDVSERIVVLTVEVREEDLVRAAAAAPLQSVPTHPSANPDANYISNNAFATINHHS